VDIPNFRSLDEVYLNLGSQRWKLEPIEEIDFFEKWWTTIPQMALSRSRPTNYYVYGTSLLYLLPIAEQVYTVSIHYHRRVVDLVAPTDVPITPSYLDEAIMLATLIRVHERVHEVVLAGQARADLEEIFDEMRVDDDNMMAEEQERTVPDDQWA
jgi:hypothetical protein